MTRNTGGTQSLATQAHHGAADVGAAERVEGVAGGEPQQAFQVAPVGVHRMRRQPPLGGEVLQIARDRLGQRVAGWAHPCRRTSVAPTSWLRRSR